VTKVVKGYRHPEWVKTRERNEALDTRVYGRAAAAQYGIDRFTERHWKALEEQVGRALSEEEQESMPRKTRATPVRRVIRSRFLDR
jgi:phage terminase large subunit GpA-like protein